MSNNSRKKFQKKHSSLKARPKLNFVDKEYDFDFNAISEPCPEDLIDERYWKEGAQKLTGTMVMMVVGPAGLFDWLVSISGQILQGLPKRLVVQAAQSAEDILNSGKSGHFVTVQNGSGEVVRFDTALEAAHFAATRPGAAASTQHEIERHLFSKAEQLEFLI